MNKHDKVLEASVDAIMDALEARGGLSSEFLEVLQGANAKLEQWVSEQLNEDLETEIEEVVS